MIRQALAKRGVDIDLDAIIELDTQHRSIITEIQKYKQQRNELSEKVGQAKRHGKDPEHLMDKARTLNTIIKEKEKTQREVEHSFNKAAQWLPNIPHDSVPGGLKSEDNQFIRGLAESPTFDIRV